MIKLELTPDQFKRLTGVQMEKMPDRFPDLYEDGELKEGADIFGAIIDLNKIKIKEHGDNQWKASRKSLEKHLKAAGIDDFDKAEEGLELLVQQLKGEQGKDPAVKLTEEEVMKHPAFSAAVEAKVKALKESKEKIEAEFSEFKIKQEFAGKNAARKNTFLSALRELNAGFGPKGEEAAINAFLALHPDKYVNEKGEIVNDKGEPIQDKEFNKQSVTDFLKSEWLFGMNQAPAHNSPPPANGGGNGSPAPKYNITSKAQFEELLSKAAPKDKADLWASYNAVADKIK